MIAFSFGCYSTLKAFLEKNGNEKSNEDSEDVSCCGIILLVLGALSIILFSIMHFIDIICYFFGIYYDGRGAPFK